MGTKIEEKKIGETVYVVSQFGALEGHRLLFRLSKLASPMLAGLAAGGDVENKIGAALSGWTEHAKEEDFTFLCASFAKQTKIKQTLTSGQVIELDLEKQFDSHFAGRYGEMMIWLVFCIRVNYASFLSEIKSELSGLLGSLGIRMQSGSKSPPE